MSNQGFGRDGVAKGSPASDTQSDIGNVNKGSGFSNAQATGARGGDVGFGSGGVSKGSPAADMHSDIGNVNKGSGFSNAQRGGAKNN